MDCLLFAAVLLGASATGGVDTKARISRHVHDSASALLPEVKPLVMRSGKIHTEGAGDSHRQKPDREMHIDSAGRLTESRRTDASTKQEFDHERREGSHQSEGELIATNADGASQLNHSSNSSKAANLPVHDDVVTPVGEELLGPTFETTTKPPPECEERSGGYMLCKIMMGHECNSVDKDMSKHDNLHDCADSVFAAGGKFMVFGSGVKAGECYHEKPEVDVQDCYINQDAASCCPDLYERDHYDFYIVVSTSQRDKIHAVEGWSGSIHGHGLLSIVALAVIAVST